MHSVCGRVNHLIIRNLAGTVQGLCASDKQLPWVCFGQGWQKASFKVWVILSMFDATSTHIKLLFNFSYVKLTLTDVVERWNLWNLF